MRRFVTVLGTVAIVLVCLGREQLPGLAQAQTADSVMAAARTALGGEAKIAGNAAGPGGPLPASKPAPGQRLYFADYHDVDGLKLPFRIRRAAGAETTEETTFDRYRINAKVDPRRFDNREVRSHDAHRR